MKFDFAATVSVSADRNGYFDLPLYVLSHSFRLFLHFAGGGYTYMYIYTAFALYTVSMWFYFLFQ